ncbi:DUF1292 domain-containing protein [Crassaminicella thermophila]|uniref:DUF1292 domain-containing protein n=1 Tax=Crassaminicella thermophila TaxID=2599308 RepID=UPI001E3E5043|nr:DUF1292 domain-containing protein [Crassaminicella thermophila]
MENNNIITLLDEDGKEMDFEIIATLKVNDFEYAILQPLDENDDEEVVIFKIVQVDREEVLENVQNEEELNLVLEAYEELFNEKKK